MSLTETGHALLPVFSEMQRSGMPAHRPYFENLRDEMTDEMARIGSRISHRYFGDRPFNPKSPKHVGALLRRRGLEPLKRTAKGMPSTGKDSIEYLRYEDPAIEAVFDWRERQHVRDSFCKPILARIPPEEEIYPVRCQIKPTRTATRRLAASEPNLLNIPTRTALGRRVREGFRCVEGEVFGAWDLSQIELRVAAHVSQDEVLCRYFQEGRDVHTETAAQLFGVDVEAVTKEQRYMAKTAGFGRLYGQGAHGMRILLWKEGLVDWTEKQCAKLIRGWLEIHSGIAEYMEGVERRATEMGYVEDLFGMRRYLPGIWSPDRGVRAEAARIAVNHTIQGTAQGMIQSSMVWLREPISDLQEAGWDICWALQIHDELMFRFPPQLWEMLDELITEALTRHCGIRLRVPVEVGGIMAQTWAGLGGE